jgi:glycosyltransferase involved in cell wall biosynthesis
MRILMLATDGYGCIGGIAQFNRDFLDALSASPLVERITVWPRHAPEPLADAVPEAVVYDRAAATGKGAYLLRALSALLRPPPLELVICAHLHLLPLAWLLARRSGAPLALVLFGIECWRPTRNPVTNLLAGAADDVLSVSRFTAKKFCAWSKVARERCVILPPCVDLERMTPGEKCAELQARYGLVGHRTIMTMGRLSPVERYKGFDAVIELTPRLVEKYPDLKYLIVGEGEDSERLKDKAARLGVADRVVFAGRVSESEKPSHFRLADVFVMPSWGEGFGIVLIEAAACGARVVGSGADASREALLDGALGAVVNPRDMDEVFDALVGALETPRAPVRNVAVNAFSRPAFQKRVADWLESVARAAPARTANP